MSLVWSQNAWESIVPLFKKITSHPFLVGLKDGSLPFDNFLFYLKQDAFYLNNFKKMLDALIVRNSNKEHIKEFLTFANEAIKIERELHQFFTKKTVEDNTMPSPSCLLCTSFMHRQVAIAPLEVIMASMLPNFWIYQAVGDFIVDAGRKENNPYQRWINTYSGEQYNQAVVRAVAITDELAENVGQSIRDEMSEAFILCSKMEWMFWESAWQMESWPV